MKPGLACGLEHVLHHALAVRQKHPLIDLISGRAPVSEPIGLRLDHGMQFIACAGQVDFCHGGDDGLRHRRVARHQPRQPSSEQLPVTCPLGSLTGINRLTPRQMTKSSGHAREAGRQSMSKCCA